MLIKTDCKYFLSDRPCIYHKTSKIICEKCKYYVKNGEKVIIIKLGALGDVLRTTSILQLLSKKYKNSLIYWVTYRNAVPLLENISYIKQILAYDVNTLVRVLIEKFDILINLDLSEDALYLASIINAKKKFGYWIDNKSGRICFSKKAAEWFYLSHNDILKKKNQKTYQEHILNILGLKSKDSNEYRILVNLTENEKIFSKIFSDKNKINKTADIKIIGLNTGGGAEWRKKEWPVKHTVKLIRLLLENNKNNKILIFGGQKEKERNKNIFSLIPTKLLKENSIIDTGTNNTLREFMALIDLCDIVVTTDTLALHIALGLNKKVVALFGPTSDSEIEMYKLGTKILSPIECSICYNRNCNKEPDCMELITPEIVYKTIISQI